jgi:hypothetical protein
VVVELEGWEPMEELEVVRERGKKKAAVLVAG